MNHISSVRQLSPMTLHRPRPWVRNCGVLLAIGMASVPGATYALSVAGGAKWGTPGNNGQDLKLGPTSSQTCFLNGVSGDFNGNPQLYGTPNSYLPASAEVLEKNGYWYLRTRAGTGKGVMGHAICINATANRVETAWSNNVGSGGVPATPKRQCFLSKVYATTGLSSTKAHMTLKKEADKFYLTGYVNNIAGDTGFGGAEARCVDVEHGGRWDFTHGATAGTTKTITLRNSFPNGTPVPVAQVGCFLTGISGKWSGTQFGWEDGSFTTGDTNASPNWQMTSSNGRQGTVVCLK